MPDVFGQPTLDERNKKTEEQRQQIACVNNGGKWDSARKVCIPKAELDAQKAKFDAANATDKTKEKPQPPATDDPVLKMAREKGLTLQQAAEVLIAKSKQSPDKQLAQASANNTNVQNAQVEQQQLINQQIQASQTAQVSGQTPEIATNNNFQNAATGAAALGGAIGGAQVGATVGTTIAPGIGTIVGGIVGAVGGAIGGAFVKLSVEERGNVKKADRIWKTAKTNKNEILNMVNSGLLTEGRARQLWAQEKSNIALAHSYLKEQTQSSLKDFLGSPGDELINVEAYLSLDSSYDVEFERALLTPDPRKVVFTPQDVSSD